jgi:four helix bundle protein
MADYDWSSDEPWDENQWEAFLRENDKRVDRYMELLHDFLQAHPRPGRGDPDRLALWKDDLRAFIERKGWSRDDLALPFIWLEESDDLEENPLFRLDDTLDEDAFFDEDLLAESEDDMFSLDSLERLPIYQQAFDLTSRVMDWSDDVPGGVKDSTLVQFCASIMQIPAKVAEGHAIGYERDMLGGNIACVKRALGAANAALTLLRQLKREPYLPTSTYRKLYEETYELRNALGLYVQELRERFNLGID